MVNFVDTCVLTNLLDIPGFNQDRDEVKRIYREKEESNDTFVIPLAVLVETGNHIAQLKGDRKYPIAESFSKLIREAIQGSNGFVVTPEITLEQIGEIMAGFPDSVVRQDRGFGDLSIISQFEDYWKNKQPLGKMCIWSLDHHLQGFEKEGGLKRRKDK